MDKDHWEEVRNIYQEGIDTGQATFEKSPPDSWEQWTAKFLSELSLVCLEGGQVLGWAAVSPVSTRRVYGGVGEVSLYIAPQHQRKGIGKALLEALCRTSEEKGFWTLQAGIFPENQASVQLHMSCGFRVVGERKGIGKMSYGPRSGQWRDVLLLERRSEIAGVN